MVSNSPWPFLAGMSCYSTTLYLAFFFKSSSGSTILMMVSVLTLVGVSNLWWRDVIRESTFQGSHTREVKKGLYLGFALFIISEVMFFFSFFFSFFFLSLSPSVEMGACWPPEGVCPPSYFHIPLFNTVLLLSSGVSLTWCHHGILEDKKMMEKMISISFTILLGWVFLTAQYFEYKELSFSIADSAYGSTFFIMTGFHGFHVLIGVIFILVCLFRMINGHFGPNQCVGFEASAWYWHFVDVVWLYLYFFLYFWSN